MTAFKRLSAAPTVPDLLRRQAERRAIQSCRAWPAAACWRSATVAIAWDHRLDGSLFRPGRVTEAGSVATSLRPAAEPAHARAASCSRAAQRPTQANSNAVIRSRRAAAQPGLSAHTLRSWQCQAGMAACFAGASSVLAATRLLNRCCLLSPDGIVAALAGADRLTRAGMRLWRSSRASRRT